MTVAEIKEQVRRMTPEERREIVRLIAEIEDAKSAEPRQAANFAEAKAYVFENYGELLRRLAQ
jgi:hypothetical protein